MISVDLKTGLGEAEDLNNSESGIEPLRRRSNAAFISLVQRQGLIDDLSDSLPFNTQREALKIILLLSPLGCKFSPAQYCSLPPPL